MDFALRGMINKSVVVYPDDMTIYSKNRAGHILNLTKILEICRKYGISLNLKTIFGVTKGKLTGHNISKDGIHIDLERVKLIS